jgi:putative transposase
VIVLVGINSDGRREILGLDIGPCEAETFCTFLRKLVRRGLRGIKLVMSDAHEGIKAAAGSRQMRICHREHKTNYRS